MRADRDLWVRAFALCAICVFVVLAARAGVGLKEAQQRREASPVEVIETNLRLSVGEVSWHFRCSQTDPRPTCYNVELLLTGTDADPAPSSAPCAQPVPVRAAGELRGQSVSLGGSLCPSQPGSEALLSSLFALAPERLHTRIAAELYAVK